LIRFETEELYNQTNNHLVEKKRNKKTTKTCHFAGVSTHANPNWCEHFRAWKNKTMKRQLHHKPV